MIFVTVGTHEQPFDRLIEYMDKLAATIEEDVVIQSGFSTYVPQNCTWKKLFSYTEMNTNVEQARVVITHGGPSSFIAPLQIGKIPIVVPRRKEFNEHVNDHQLNFCREVAKRQKCIIEVEDVKELKRIIEKYDEIIMGMKNGLKSNNEKFCRELAEMVRKMFIMD